ncbi:MAG: DUF6677 family protein [Thermoguttaceae bacterium]
MSESTASVSPTSSLNEEEIVNVKLKNPIIAGILTWLVPGLGHFYQGRYFKAIINAVCILPIFFIGCYLGSAPDVGIARNVYYSWREGDKRLFFIPQCGLGLAAIPAIIQANRVYSGEEPFWNGMMSPPLLNNPSIPQNQRGYPPTLDQIIYVLGRYFEMGTVFTLVAGMMNVLAIFDAIDGPALIRRKEEKEGEK